MIRSLAKQLGFLLYVPFIVVLLPFIALGIGIVFVNAIVSGLFQRARWLRDLRRNGRVIPEADFLANTNGGTLIVDRPGFNLNGAHCWWTSENVIDFSPVPMPSDDERMDLCTSTKETTAHEFDLWCWIRYISPETGSAILVLPPRHGEAMAKKIREHLPDLRTVTSWSVVASMQSRAANVAAKPDEFELE